MLKKTSTTNNHQTLHGLARNVARDYLVAEGEQTANEVASDEARAEERVASVLHIFGDPDSVKPICLAYVLAVGRELHAQLRAARDELEEHREALGYACENKEAAQAAWRRAQKNPPSPSRITECKGELERSRREIGRLNVEILGGRMTGAFLTFAGLAASSADFYALLASFVTYFGDGEAQLMQAWMMSGGCSAGLAFGTKFGILIPVFEGQPDEDDRKKVLPARFALLLVTGAIVFVRMDFTRFDSPAAILSGIGGIALILVMPLLIGAVAGSFFLAARSRFRFAANRLPDRRKLEDERLADVEELKRLQDGAKELKRLKDASVAADVEVKRLRTQLSRAVDSHVERFGDASSLKQLSRETARRIDEVENAGEFLRANNTPEPRGAGTRSPFPGLGEHPAGRSRGLRGESGNQIRSRSLRNGTGEEED